jgi:hypothetical protein
MIMGMMLALMMMKWLKIQLGHSRGLEQIIQAVGVTIDQLLLSKEFQTSNKLAITGSEAHINENTSVNHRYD